MILNIQAVNFISLEVKYMRAGKFFAAVLAAAMTLAMPINAAAAEIDLAPQTETKAVTNPHKGWVQYVYSPWYFESPEEGVKNNPAWDITSVVYSRFHWKYIETDDGVYDWSAIDEMISLCEENGKTFAFGICPSDSGLIDEKGLVPQFVYDKGCKYVMAKASSFYNESSVQRTPVWDDPVYLKEFYKFSEALAEKYDGNKSVEFIDIRAFGNWGEWHTYGLEGSTMPSVTIRKQCIEKWSKLFKKTTVVFNASDSIPELNEYAVSKGVTLRRDGLLGVDNSARSLLPAVGKLPAIGEMCYGYSYLADRGKWSDSELNRAINDGKLTYLALGGGVSDGTRMYNERKDSVISAANRLGYNFTVTSAKLDTSDKTSTLTFKVKNTGTAPAFFPLTMKIAFTDKNGNVLKITSAQYDVGSGSFASGKVRTYKFKFKNSGVPKNAYISLGLFENAEDEQPNVKFCNKNTAENNFLVLGKYRRK